MGCYSSYSNSPTEEEEKLVSGSIITIMGDQAGTKGTPENKRNRGQNKLFLPNFGRNYYYSVFTDRNINRGSFTKKGKTILSAAKVLWIPSEICKKYVYYWWWEFGEILSSLRKFIIRFAFPTYQA